MENSSENRIIVLVDMDCFYVQVEQKLCPEYENKPCAVVQYKTWKGGGIIAVNYEARARGVTRMLRGDEAQKMCPDIHLFRVPEVRGKADLTRYREAGARVLDVLCEYSNCVERASIDEAYLDMTAEINSKVHSTPPVTADQLPNTFVVGWDSEDPETRRMELEKWLKMIYEEDYLYNDRMLAMAAVIVEEMRTAVYEKTGYRCSAGVAHNKMLAKLSCGIHKPNKQTVLPQSSIQLLFNTIPVKKVRNLGGKLGEEIVKKFNTEKMGDLFHVPKSQLVSSFGEKTGNWLYNLARGIENEPVTARQLPKSIGCGKNFPGKTSLSTKDQVTHWLKQLSTELEERLVKDQKSNRRIARLLTISIRNHDSNGFSTISRSCPIHIYNAEKLAHDALLTINKLNISSNETQWKPSIWTLSLAASKFEDRLYDNQCSIQSFFSNKSFQKENSEQNDVLPRLCGSGKVENETSSTPKTVDCMKNSKRKVKDIASFFAKEQNSKSESIVNIENIDITQSDNSIHNEQGENSMLSDCCDAIDDLQDDGVITDFYCEELKPSSADETSRDSAVNKLESPKVGFFAKKLAERKLAFDIDFGEKSCDVDSNVNEPIENEMKSMTSELDNFIKPSTSAVNDTDSFPIHNSPSKSEDVCNLDPELTKLCDKCNKRIPIWEEEEHLDYHVAIDLSKEFSTKSIAKSVSLMSKSSNNTAPQKSKHSSKKRGNMTKSSNQSKKAFVQSNTLDAFFKH